MLLTNAAYICTVGYLLYVYKGHLSPVTTVRFSPTGRYLVSGSDYGERKILLWDARCPEMNNAKQFPHYIFWTPEGLIRKLLIRQGTPKPSFWLQRAQLGVIPDDRLIDFWPGELDDPNIEVFESESESSGSESDDSSDDETTLTSAKINAAADAADEAESSKSGSGKRKKKKKKEKVVLVDELTKNDVRKAKGVTLSVILVNSSGDQVDVKEYNPGGSAIVCLQVSTVSLCFTA